MEPVDVGVAQPGEEPLAVATAQVGDRQDDATAALQQAGFQVVVVQQDVTDPGVDGIVLRQNPAGGAQAKIGVQVTITVGKLVQTTTSTPSGTGAPPWTRASRMDRLT